MNKQTSRTYITYSELMSMANKRASKIFKHRKAQIDHVERRNAFYKSGGHKFEVQAPSNMSWGQALSSALKALYQEHFVVAILSNENKQHNASILEWQEVKRDEQRKLNVQMANFERQRMDAGWKNYTGD